MFSPGAIAKALALELGTRLNLADLDTYIKEFGLYKIPLNYSNFSRNWRKSFPSALADAAVNGNHARLSKIVIDIFSADIVENRTAIQDEFEENPWKISEVLSNE